MTPITLCITTYNRFELTMRSFKKVLSNLDIDRIVVYDDGSKNEYRAKLISAFNDLGHADVKLWFSFSTTNVGMMRSKAKVVEESFTDWVILFDSDNIIDERYINALKAHWEKFPPQTDTIYLPSFAMPNFDMRAFEGQTITKKNVKYFVGKPGFSWLMNVCNYVVPRDNYLKIFEYNSEIKATDTLYFAINWLSKGFKFVVVPGMVYEHTVHDGSGFAQDMAYNMSMAQKLEKQLLNL